MNQIIQVPARRSAKPSSPILERTTFRTSRLLDFCSRKELIAQTGHQPEEWPLVLLKELVDNALDACEEAEVAPEISITVDARGVAQAQTWLSQERWTEYQAAIPPSETAYGSDVIH